MIKNNVISIEYLTGDTSRSWVLDLKNGREDVKVNFSIWPGISELWHFIYISTLNIWSQRILCWGGCGVALCIAGCLSASLASVRSQLHTLLMTIKNTSTCFQISPGRQNHTCLRVRYLQQITHGILPNRLK